MPVFRRMLCCVGLSALMSFSGQAPAVAETANVRIGLQFGLAYLSVVVAQSEGLIAKRAAEAGISDLQVTLNRFSGSTAINEALLSNSIEVGTLGTAGALIAWDKTRGRQQIKSIAAVATVAYTLYANKPNINALKDFTTNDKIAVPAFNSPQAILLRVAAERQLGDKAKAEPLMANLPHPDATAALLAGQALSGYFATPPFSQVLARDPRIHPVLTSKELLGGREATATTVTASQAFVEDNPRVARAIMAGIEDATNLINRDPKRAAAIYLASEKVNLPVEEIEKILTDGSTTFSVAPEGIVTYATFMVGQGMLRKVPDSWKDVFFPLIGDRNGS
jgi:NitT/TauT family transport system substrate-binding protein